MADKTIACRTCSKDFIFTERDQEYYQERNFSEPKDCKECRIAKKQQGGGRKRNDNQNY